MEFLLTKMIGTGEKIRFNALLTRRALIVCHVDFADASIPVADNVAQKSTCMGRLDESYCGKPPIWASSLKVSCSS